jgi:hypothetical protein|tara:strand:- start:2799 stop:3119 length:321 start_codon:yes stop_codon:yes gene_type:complete
MKVVENDLYTLICVEESSFGNLVIQLPKISSNHTLLKLSENIIIVEEKITFFLKVALDLKVKDKSFVIIKKGLNIDDFPEILNITPTLQEAKDILEMEAIERDLGF